MQYRSSQGSHCDILNKDTKKNPKIKSTRSSQQVADQVYHLNMHNVLLSLMYWIDIFMQFSQLLNARIASAPHPYMILWFIKNIKNHFHKVVFFPFLSFKCTVGIVCLQIRLSVQHIFLQSYIQNEPNNYSSVDALENS